MDDSLSHLSISLKSTLAITASLGYFHFSSLLCTLLKGALPRIRASCLK